MAEEYFYNEHPLGDDDSPSGSWQQKTDPTGDPGGGWGGGGGGGGGGGDWGGILFPATQVPPALNRTAGGSLLLDGEGNLVSCAQKCAVIPALIFYLAGKDCAGHGRCVLCKLSDEARPLRSETYPAAAGRPLGSWIWPLGAPGSYEVYAKWQAGHYDHAEIHDAKFVIYGVSTGWLTLPLNSYRRVAEITVDELYRLTVNGQPASLRGNKSFLENA